MYIAKPQTLRDQELADMTTTGEHDRRAGLLDKA